MNWGVEVLQTSALPLGYVAIKWSGKRDSNSRPSPWQGDALPLSYFRRNGASGQNRTADTRIFSPLLYRLSYRGKLATLNGFEPSISAVTGRHVRPLHHRAIYKLHILLYSIDSKMSISFFLLLTSHLHQQQLQDLLYRF